jgi:uncharacterized membrane protein YeaQ/YmgE (transglycosylase-associated protein family)
MLIGVVGWIVLGLITGLVVSKFVNLRGDDPRIGIVAGGAGALVGGVLYSLISGTEITAFNMVTLMVAAIGAVVALCGWHGWRKYNTI